MSAHHGDPNVKIRTDSDVKWLEFGAQVGKLVNQWANRNDIIAYVGPNSGQTGMNPTALYNPWTAEVEVNTDTAFGKKRKPKHVGDFLDLSVQRKFPAAAGAILHEAAHARFTSWDLKHAHDTLEPEENAALHLLEETRAEGMMTTVHPKLVPFLRACALDIVLQDMSKEPEPDPVTGETPEPPSAVQVMGNLAALALARVDAGVLQKHDVRKIRDLVEKNLPADLLTRLTELWQEFQSYTTVDQEKTRDRMYDIAREWAKLLRELAEERGEQMTKEEQQAMAEAMAQAAKEAIESDSYSASAGADGDIERQEQQEAWDESNAERSKERKEREANAMAKKEVFDGKKGKDEKKQANGRGTQDYWGATNGRIEDERPPTGPERVQANRVAEALERAKYHDRIRTVAPDELPPGRLKTRAVVQNAAYASMGIQVKSEPWRRVRRRHVIDPNLTVGIMVDVSGSMSSAMQPMASIAWIVSEAVRRIQGRAAMVYYGNQVIPALYPGEHLDKVRVRSAHDSTERFDLAFRSLDGALNLTDGTGARLLVVVSDGHYTSSERTAAHAHMKKCAETGVAVAWLGIDYHKGYGADPAEDYVKKYPSAIHKYVGSDLSNYARVIGDAAEAALNKAGEA